MRISDWSSDVCSSDLLADRVEAREVQPFGVDVQLHFVPARDDRTDDLGDDLWPIDERRHRIDEEDAGQAVIVEHVHLEMDAEIAIAAAAEDRAVEIGARVDAPPVKAGGKLGVETDDRPRHAAILAKGG